MEFSFLLPLLVSGAGLFMLIKLRFFFVLHPKRCFRAFFAELSSVDSRRALFLALAGTLGVGNIFGVAAGIMIGGAGSVFWLIVSSVFSMALKYSETALAVDMKKGRGGMQCVIERAFPIMGGRMAKIYSIACLVLAFCMGAAMQSAACTDTLKVSIGAFSGASAVALSLLVAISVLRGGAGIERISARLIPLASLAYIIISLMVIIFNFDRLPSVLSEIISGAFSHSAVLGGGVSFLLSRALSEGFARGIMSNEAGVGTSAMAHSRSDKRSGEVAGLFGICEVFFDTVILCGLTALVVLTSVTDISAYDTPMSLVGAAFEAALGAGSHLILSACTAIFSFSTIICWYYYGGEALFYLFGKKGGALYTFVFMLAIILGALTDGFFLISVTDTALFLMAAITLSAVVRFSGRVAHITKKLYK